jgi:uncharacterized protein YegL
MVLFFVVDTSGSMSGDKIGSVNTAISEILPELADISAENTDAQIKIAALQFSSGAKWLYGKPIEAESFRWNDLSAGGITDFGEACKMLNQKLSKNEFMKDVVGSFAPVIILLSDGEPTDKYKKDLDALKSNNWFKAGIKIAIAIGEDANLDVLKEFTGNIECVITAHSPEALKKLIRFVSVRASQIGSKSTAAGAGGKDKQTQIGEQIQEEVASIADVQNSPDGDSW